MLPAHAHVDGLVVGCSLLAPRSMPLFVAMRVIRDRVFSTLRLERGLCYSVFDDDDRVGVRDSLFVTGCDVAEGHGAEVIEAFVGVLGSVAGGEITPEEVRDCLRVVDAVGILGSIAAGRRGRAEGGRRTARAHPRDLGRPGGPSGCLDRSRRRGELGGCARQRPARRAGGRGRPGSVRRGTRAATGSEGQRPALRAVGREHGRRGGARAGGREPGDRSERHHGGGLR
ncbi:MAG: insulinase family protein [Actinomycetota bacterium]